MTSGRSLALSEIEEGRNGRLLTRSFSSAVRTCGDHRFCTCLRNPSIFAAFCLQFRLIRVHDHLAVTVENAEVEHVFLGDHDDHLVALSRDAAAVVRRGKQVRVIGPGPAVELLDEGS